MNFNNIYIFIIPQFPIKGNGANNANKDVGAENHDHDKENESSEYEEFFICLCKLHFGYFCKEM